MVTSLLVTYVGDKFEMLATVFCLENIVNMMLYHKLWFIIYDS